MHCSEIDVLLYFYKKPKEVCLTISHVRCAVCPGCPVLIQGWWVPWVYAHPGQSLHRMDTKWPGQKLAWAEAVGDCALTPVTVTNSDLGRSSQILTLQFLKTNNLTCHSLQLQKNDCRKTESLQFYHCSVRAERLCAVRNAGVPGACSMTACCDWTHVSHQGFQWGGGAQVTTVGSTSPLSQLVLQINFDVCVFRNPY